MRGREEGRRVRWYGKGGREGGREGGMYSERRGRKGGWVGGWFVCSGAKRKRGKLKRRHARVERRR